MRRCPTCGRARRVQVDETVLVRLATTKGLSASFVADILGINRKTAARIARERGVIFGKHRVYNPRDLARHGEQNGRAQITRRQAHAIRHSEDSAKALAKRYSLSTVQINKIRRGASWQFPIDRMSTPH